MGIKVVKKIDYNTIDYVLCVRETDNSPFSDNKKGNCIECGTRVQFRPYIPDDAVKICLECMNNVVSASNKKL